MTDDAPAPDALPPVDIAIAFQAALAARRETFLARYPRKLKLAATGLLFLALILPYGLGRGISSHPTGSSSYHDEEGEDDLDLSSIPTTLDKSPTKERHEPRTEDEKQAATLNDANIESLSIAPDMALVEETPTGFLPKIAEDGRRPWQVYAKTFDFRDPRPRIALVIGDMGFSRVATDAALHRLPPSVTLAFDVQGTAIDEWITRARQDGHETLLSLPMEPFDYPRNDSGPQSLLTTLPNSDNMTRLRDALRLAQGYVGLTTLSGSHFVTDSVKMEPVLEEARKRGLLFLDAKIASRSIIGDLAVKMKVPTAQSVRFIDSTPTPQAIDAALAQLEQIAHVEGAVVAMASPLPVTFERIEIWVRQLSERGIALVPLSSVVR